MADLRAEDTQLPERQEHCARLPLEPSRAEARQARAQVISLGQLQVPLSPTHLPLSRLTFSALTFFLQILEGTATFASLQ